MPGSHSAKQKRQAKHIADSERKRGVSSKRAESIGWATVNKKLKKNQSLAHVQNQLSNASSVASRGPSKPTKTPSHLTHVQNQLSSASSIVGKSKNKQKTKKATAIEYDPNLAAGTALQTPPPAPPPVKKSKRSFNDPTLKKDKLSTAGIAQAQQAQTTVLPLTKKMKLDKAGETAVHGKRDHSAMGAITGHAITRMARDTGVTGHPPNPAGNAVTRYGITAVRKKPRDMKATKAFRVMTLDDYHATIMKTEGSGGPASPAAPTTTPKKFPRKEKPTIQLKPVGETRHQRTGATVKMRAIADEEAQANLAAGKHLRGGYEKAMKRLLAIKKALATGYGKVSGGGALKAPNRGRSKRPIDITLSLTDFNRAMEAMPRPSGPTKPPSYLPGVHNPKSPMRPKMGLKKPSRGGGGAAASSDVKSMSGKKSVRPTTSSKHSPRVLDGGGATELSNSVKTVVQKSEGDGTMSKTNFNDLFKAELGAAADDVLCDCPHCEAPITKSDLEKARGHKGKGATTHQSGAKHGKSSAHVVDQNPTGGNTRGGDGHGVHTPSRGVPGAKKHDAVVGVQNGKGTHARKAVKDSDSDDASSDDASSGKAAPVKKSLGPTYRGTDFVQYVDYGDAPGSDAFIAKSISEGSLGGTQPTQPMDLNNDLTRLLI
jgi:hypothetical protein